MPKGINLLIRKKEISVAKTRFLRFAKVGSFVLLIFYCVVVVGVFSIWLLVRQERRKVQQTIAVKEEKIADLQRIESLQILLKQRLSSLETIIGKKAPDYKNLLLYFDKFSLKGIGFNDIALTQEGEIDFSGEATNAVTFADFLEELFKGEGKDLFSRVILSSVTRQKEGAYTFSLDLTSQ